MNKFMVLVFIICFSFLSLGISYYSNFYHLSKNNINPSGMIDYSISVGELK